MLIISVFCLLLTLGYVMLLVAYRVGWKRQKDFMVPLQFMPSTRISLIIPARNEAANIGACIESILAQKYPEELYEVIVVDDHSQDNTKQIVEDYALKNICCINLADHLPSDSKTNSYKKAAIATGIAFSTGELIVTTDADCTAPNTWLLHIASMYEQSSPTMIVAPVVFKAKKNIVQLFQLIDFMGMQGVTGAAHSLRLGNMSNGANLAFTKEAFNQVGGYDGVSHLASGDDYLLMMKINKQMPGSICYLKSANATVSTLPQPDWRSFLQQRIRWASKSGKYNDPKLTLILLLVYLFNLALISLAIASLFDSSFLFLTTAVFVLKLGAEYYFLKPVSHFFHADWVLWYFPFFQPLHVIYIVIAGLLGFVGGYEWKGRRVK